MDLIISFFDNFSLFQIETKTPFTNNVGHVWFPFRKYFSEKIIEKERLQFQTILKLPLFYWVFCQYPLLNYPVAVHLVIL